LSEIGEEVKMVLAERFQIVYFGFQKNVSSIPLFMKIKNCHKEMYRTAYYSLFHLFFLAIAIGCKGDQRKEIQTIYLPENLEVIHPENSVKFDNNWYKNEFKVVVFVKNAGPYSTLDLDWQSAITDFPNIAFLFFVSEKDKTKLIDHLEIVGFTHPVIHDPDEAFRKSNVKERELTFISFLVRNDNIVGMSNPSFTDFKKRLEELSK